MRLQERMRHYKVPGISVAVLDRGRLAWARAYGVAEENRRLLPTTLLQAASISKPVAAVAALRLVEAGRLALDEPVNDRLTTWRLPENAFTAAGPVTLRQLLSHSGGLTVHGFEGYAAGRALPSLRQILDGEAPANSAPIRVDQQPGTVWRYSGGGYVVLQQLMSDVSGRPFEQFLRREVLLPLGMTSSLYAQPLPSALASRAAAAHDSNGEPLPGRWHVYPELAAAGLWTTPTDLSRFLLSLMPDAAPKAKHVLRPATIAQMLTPQPGLKAGAGGMGLGLFVEGEGQAKRFSHTGVNEGFRAYVVGFPATGQGAVFMTNGENGMPLIQEVLRAVAAEYRWPYRFQREVRAVPLDAGQLLPLAGRYRFAPGASGVVTISLAGNSLQAATGETPPVSLLATAADRFISTGDATVFTFHRDSRGAVDAVEAELASGQKITARRENS
jgi:CubicO group peptidase (beta-lactamase class C family)